MLRHHHPGPHPGVKVAVDANDLGPSEGNGNRPALGLNPVKDKIATPTNTIKIIKKPITIQKLHHSSNQHNDHTQNEFTLLLIHLDNKHHTSLRIQQKRHQQYHDITQPH